VTVARCPDPGEEGLISKMAAPNIDRAQLAQRIQGFGNVNPPPLEEETGGTMAKKAIGRLGDMVGEEVMLTVEDFKEKGAVGAVKDAVADAGDILIDGVSGIIGWIRGDPPPEDSPESTEDATRALSNGPSGAAYGISQASPTGGINAVWVMPDEADPSALASLAQQSGGLMPQQNDPRVPKNIQPYQPQGSRNVAPPLPSFGGGLQIPGGPTIAPYQPAPSGPPGRAAPFVPGMGNAGQPAWGPAGYAPGAPNAGLGGGVSQSSTPSGAKGLVERIAKGEVLVGPDVAKRLVSQCQAAKTRAKQLGDMVCERVRRLYLGLDGSDPADADASIARLLSLTNELNKQGTDFSNEAVKVIKAGVSEELLSLRSSAKHKDSAETMLRNVGLVEGGSSAAAETADLLGGDSKPSTNSPASVMDADLLGGSVTTSSPAVATNADLLGGMSTSSVAPAAAPLASSGIASLDPLLGPTSTPSVGGSSLFGGLDLNTPVPTTVSPGAGAAGTPNMATLGATPGTMAAGAFLPQGKKDEDAFGFVGAEILKASGQK